MFYIVRTFILLMFYSAGKRLTVGYFFRSVTSRSRELGYVATETIIHRLLTTAESYAKCAANGFCVVVKSNICAVKTLIFVSIQA